MKEEAPLIVISLSEIGHLFKLYRHWIQRGALIGLVIALSSALLRLPTYPAEATFQDLSRLGLGPESGLEDLFAEMSIRPEPSKGPSSLTLLHSRTLLEGPIRQLGVQAELVPTFANPGSWLYRISRNLKIELLALFGHRRLPIADPSPYLQVREVQFDGELPLDLWVRFRSEDSFDLYKGRRRWITGCPLGEPVKSDQVVFTLIAKGEVPLRGRRYRLHLCPLDETVKRLEKTLAIEEDEKDPRLLRLSYRHPDRHFGAELLNTLLLSYEGYLDRMRLERAEKQLAYLEERRAATLSKAQALLEKSAGQLGQSLGAGHFVDMKSEIAFLSKAQALYADKLLAIDLELKFLDLLERGGATYSDLYLDSPTITSLLSQINQLRQQRDSLDFALKQGKEEEELSAQFEKQMAKLQRLQERSEEIQGLLAAVDPEEGQRAYLEKALHTCDLKAKIVRDQMAYPQSESSEFQGITLEMGRQLYLRYSEKLDELERTISRLTHLRSQLDQPGFEVSSLSGVVESELCDRVVLQASETLLQLQDEKNRTPKEQERLRHQLDLQRQFIALHLDQNLELLTQDRALICDKIDSLQRTTLSLLHQDLSLLEGEMVTFAKSRKRTLAEERLLYQEQLAELRSQSLYLPEKWLTEQELDLAIATSSEMVRSITELVESKNIAHHLDFVDAKMLDRALPATIPNPPHLLLFSLLGALVGASGTFVGGVVYSALKGAPQEPPPLPKLGPILARAWRISRHRLTIWAARGAVSRPKSP